MNSATKNPLVVADYLEKERQAAGPPKERGVAERIHKPVRGYTEAASAREVEAHSRSLPPEREKCQRWY